MTPDVETLIIGAGISGIGAGIELLRRGNPSFALLESASALGGTWRDNTYPGVAVDIPSASYCFSFETDYPWSREYATGAEVQRYVSHCAETYGVTGHIRYQSRAVRCQFDNARDIWTIQIDDGTVVTSRYLIAATGLFSQPMLPAIPGLATFAGKAMHTARWDHDYDLASKRVAVIGTGASAVQVVPEIAPLATELRVFQRTPIWIGPRLDRSLHPSSRLSLRRFSVIRKLRRLVSESSLEFLTFSIVNYRRLPFLVRLVQRCVRVLMRRQVRDQVTAEALLPGYGLGCKRPAISNRYLPTFNRENVCLITQPIERICPKGIVTADQTLHEVDAIVLATGFLTTEQGNAPAFEVVGRDGVELGQFWTEHRRQAYAGVSVPGFPNFFLTAGPYSGGFNWFAMLEANLAHIMACIDGARARGVTRVEVSRDVHERYMGHMWRRAEGTVFKDRSCVSANSYYLDRHDDPSLPLPHTPWWRLVRGRWEGTRGYRFGALDNRAGDRGSQGRAA
jgi:cation diffusion facilitator CzcD-associated flavoprotein CzcO